MEKVEKSMRHFHLWSSLPDALWQPLFEQMKMISYRAADVIFPDDNTGRSLCVLLEGRANVYAPSHVADAPHTTLLRTMSNGAVFGVHCIFSSDMLPQSHIVAAKPCRVLLIPASVWERTLVAHPETMAHYVRFLSERIQFLNRKVRYLSAGSAEQRLALYLLSEIPREDTPVRIQMSAICMADLLALSRASLYRAMAQLTKDGFLVRSGHEYRLLHREKLSNFYQ